MRGDPYLENEANILPHLSEAPTEPGIEQQIQKESSMHGSFTVSYFQQQRQVKSCASSVPVPMDPDVETAPPTLPQLQRQQPVNVTETAPGAFAAAPGADLQQRQMANFSAVVTPESEEVQEDPPFVASTSIHNDGIVAAEPVESSLF